MRSGLVAQKVGMTRVFSPEGKHVPVTVLKVDECKVVAQKTTELNGYTAIQVGIGKAKPGRVSKAMKGYFAKAGMEPKQKLAEFRVSKDALVTVGSEITVEHFVPGQKVDVTGISIGKGFAGAMKRWGFKGLRATHGVSISHRSLGSTGQRQDPGRVFKNKKMSGHLGSEKVTTQNLEVVAVDAAKGLILVKGSVPGCEGGYIIVRDAVKKPYKKGKLPFPAALRSVKSETASAEKDGQNKE